MGFEPKTHCLLYRQMRTYGSSMVGSNQMYTCSKSLKLVYFCGNFVVFFVVYFVDCYMLCALLFIVLILLLASVLNT